MRCELMLSLVVLGAAGCDPSVDPNAVGAVEVAEGLDCYRWGASVLRQSRTARQPEAVTFSEGDLYLGGTPGTIDILKAQGRSGTDWTSSAGATVAQGHWWVDLEPWPDGGVIGLVGGASGFEVVRVDTEGVFTALAVLEFDQTGFIGEVYAHSDGFVVAAIEGTQEQPAAARIWSFDRTGNELWTQAIATSFTTTGNWSDRGLAVRVQDGGVVTVAVADDALADSSGGSGVRRVELDSDGVVLAEAAAAVSGTVVDLVFQDDGEVSALSQRSDFVEIRHFDAGLQTLWVQEPRDGFSIEADLLEWNPHTDRLLMLGSNRPNGGSSSGWYALFDPEGNLEWQQTTGDGGADIAVDPRGGFVVTEWRAEMRLRQVLPTACN